MSLLASEAKGLLLAAALLCAAAMTGAQPARAEVNPTTQARIANAQFLVTAVAPARAAAVCQIDSGVNLTPDTAHVVDRLAISTAHGHGDGAVADSSPASHGTLVAMVMGAGVNGFGMVGLWPAIRIVSVRANIAGQGNFTTAAYTNAIERCTAIAGAYELKVIELALASPAKLSTSQAEALAGVVAVARAHGMNVVAGAGNNDGGPVLTPAREPGILSVGGSDAEGRRCTSSAAGAALQAPGCALDAADPASGQPLSGLSGTSGASAIVAAALAAIRSWRSDLDPAAAEHALTQTARPALGGPLLDVAAAFRRLGLGAVVDAHQPAPAPRTAAKTATGGRRLARPLVRLAAARGQLGVVVSVRRRPREAVTVVSVYRRAGRKLRFAQTYARRSSRVPIPIASWQQLRVSYRDSTGRLQPSAATIVNRPRPARRRT